MSRVYPITSLPYTLPTPSLSVTPVISDTDTLPWTIRLRFYYMRYSKLIQIIGVCIIILIIIIISIDHNGSSDNLCIMYSPDTFASQVSIECFRYLWGRSCNKAVPDSYDGGWFLRSPNGGKMVQCYPPNMGAMCGAGSYKSILIYIHRCRMDENGL